MRERESTLQEQKHRRMCPVCGAHVALQARRHLPGQRVRCKSCGSWIFAGRRMLSGTKDCCPVCGRRVKKRSRRCPSCHAALRKPFWRRLLHLLSGRSGSRHDIFRFVPVDKVHFDRVHARRTVDSHRFSILLKSIEAYGILVPLVVYPKGDEFGLISGHRRLIAAHKLKLEKVPVMVRILQPKEADRVRFLENETQERWSALDRAEAIERICLTSPQSERDELMDVMNLDEETLSEELHLLVLPEVLKDALSLGVVTEQEALQLAEASEEDVFRYLEEKKQDDPGEAPLDPEQESFLEALSKLPS